MIGFFIGYALGCATCAAIVEREALRTKVWPELKRLFGK